MKIRTAFILGAGLGTRLRPWTKNIPKPLLAVRDRPLITFVMDHCLSIGIERFIVNTHHCASAYGAAFPDGHYRGMPVIFRHEPVLLDTAGGLKNVEDLLKDDDTILVYKAIFSPISRFPPSRPHTRREAARRPLSSGAQALSETSASMSGTSSATFAISSGIRASVVASSRESTSWRSDS